MAKNLFSKEDSKKRLDDAEQAKEEIYQVPNVKMYVRIELMRQEHCFTNLKQAVNFLSVYSNCDAAECLKLLRERKDKIGKWKIFYD